MNNDKPWSLVDFFVCIILVAISFFFFSKMPDEMGIKGWILFGLGALFFVIGMFRIVGTMPEQTTITGKRINAGIMVASILISQIFGFFFLYSQNGSGKGIAIATLMLCISLALGISMTDDPEVIPDKVRKVSIRIFLIALLVFAVWLNIKESFSTRSVMVGTMIIIECVVGAPLFMTKK